MPNNTLIIVRTGLWRYAIRYDDVLSIRPVSNVDRLQDGLGLDRPCLGVELGPLLDPDDQVGLIRRHALIVGLRRRYVALLVNYVDTFLEQAVSTPLPALLRDKLSEPWAVGALIQDTDVIIQIDLRAIARSILLQKPKET